MHLPLRWLAPRAHLPNPPALHTYPTVLSFLAYYLPGLLTLRLQYFTFLLAGTNLALSSCTLSFRLLPAHLLYTCTLFPCPQIPYFLILHTYAFVSYLHTYSIQYMHPLTLRLPCHFVLQACATLLPYTLHLPTMQTQPLTLQPFPIFYPSSYLSHFPYAVNLLCRWLQLAQLAKGKKSRP